MKYEQDLTNAAEHQKELEDFLQKVVKKKPKNLDDKFQTAHENAFNQIDCLECGNCCKTTSPIFRDIDVKRIAKKMKRSTREFENEYLRRDEDGDLVLKSSPCTFLNEDNTCSIYDMRPQACREYPHTDRKRVVQVMNLTKKNMLICPAVSKIVFEVKKDLF
ncbi:MAG: YkgJ family cysteine cluster protein [Flavobacteriales bacterium]|nr:YkgJ family cysteine cluster protein [Flavobacteriales bacterium]